MNVSLIGMSGAGKSYVGRRSAELLGLEFIDVDALMEAAAGKQLSEIIAQYGDEGFIALEGETTRALADRDGVLISTGGSIIYETEAMDHLCAVSRVIFLDVRDDLIVSRISGDAYREGRIVRLKDRALKELIDERRPLYEKYAHVRVDTTDLGLEAAAEAIVEAARKTL